MPDARWERVKLLFHEACERPEEERQAWLSAACGPDALLRAEVDSLLAAHHDAGAFIETPALASAGAAGAVLAESDAAPDMSSRRIGPYRVVREIGRGGMGVVYLAARDDDAFDKLVAVKVVQGGGFRPSAVLRFREERRILATLDHPNIARLLDAGTTEDDVPYVVMEYVEGEPVDVYCRARNLSTRLRLELFSRVCAAVQYSHQRLVVHRDIKASNILVTPEGTPKLLDFGIATMLEPSGAEEERTRTLLRALTPESASPEQIRGEAITVASDVYSLGALLYRLLTDRSQYRGQPRSETEIVHAICEEEPLPPSAVAAGAAGRELRGDLDVITLKALRKLPERRYPSVEQLAEDVRRHLTGHPVSARRDSAGYRAAKFVARHRVSVGAAGLVVLTLAGAFVETSRQRARAESRLRDVRKLAGSFLFEFHDAIAHLSGATAARELVVNKAVEYLSRLSAEESRDPDLLVETADAWRRLASVQGMPYESSLGRTDAARQSLEKALALLDRLTPRDRLTLAARTSRLRALNDLGSLLAAQGQSATAVAKHREAGQILDALGAGSDAPALREDRYVTGLDLGDAIWEAGDVPAATVEYRATLDHVDRWLLEAPGDPRVLHWSGVLAQRIGDALARDNRWAASLEYQRRSAEVDERLAANDPHNADTQSDLVTDYERLALAYSGQGDEPAALRELDRALAIATRLSAEDPPNAQLVLVLAETRGLRARSLGLLGRRSEAEAAFRQSIAVYRARAAEDSTNARWQEGLAERLVAQGTFFAADQRLPEARRVLAEARDIRERLGRERPDFADSRAQIAELCHQIGLVELAEAAQVKEADRCAALGRAREALACALSTMHGSPAQGAPSASGAPPMESVPAATVRLERLFAAARCG